MKPTWSSVQNILCVRLDALGDILMTLPALRALKYSQPGRRLTHVAEKAADLLAQEKILGWFQGRMKFGPRALSARSILASPLQASMQARLNEIKDREDFRPVAPVVLEEEAAQ